MQGYCNSQPLVLLWLERRLDRVMRNGCGCSGGGSSAKACAWDEYINSGLCTASLSAWVGSGRPRRTLQVWDGWVVVVVLERRSRQFAECVRRGADVAGWWWVRRRLLVAGLMVDQEDGEAEEIRLGRVCVWCVWMWVESGGGCCWWRERI